MIVVTTLLAASAALVPAPPAAPVPPVPPAPVAAVSPPAPPSIDVDAEGGQTVITRNLDGHRVTVIARAPGSGSGTAVLSYRDAAGRDVQVYSDRSVTRGEADRVLADARAQGERARAEGARAREQGRLARDAGARARVDAERIRGEALESARRAVEAARLSSRDYADLGRLGVFRDGADVTVDGRRPGPGFAEWPEVRALRDEVRALHEELKAMHAELDRERARR